MFQAAGREEEGACCDALISLRVSLLSKRGTGLSRSLKLFQDSNDL